jgi:hypothetical protein
VDDFLYGLMLGAVCGAIAILVYGYMIKRHKENVQKNREEFLRLLDEFDRQYAQYSNKPEYKEQLSKIKEQASWVGLTDAELAEFSNMKLGAYDLCLEVEAKLKEKNGGS